MKKYRFLAKFTLSEANVLGMTIGLAYKKPLRQLADAVFLFHFPLYNF